jgi:hypothetical protein
MMTSLFTMAAAMASGGSIPLLARGAIMAMTGSPPWTSVAAAKASGMEELVRVSTTISTRSPFLTPM